MLTVYKASAGAGKTHTLTGEYLKLLFTHPFAYRRILAVTFTNKATDEMKSRIIEELFRIASGQDSGHIKMLCQTHGLDKEALREQARRALIHILHDYSAFNISTIDRFFLQTMRAFTREIGLQGGYGIEMDQDMVLTEAVDNLLDGLDRSENKALLGWLLRFAEEKIEEGGEWNLRRDILALSKELFKESYKALNDQISDDITNKELLEAYQKELHAIIRAVEQEVKSLGEKGMDLLKKQGLQPSDFKGGSRSPLLWLEKLAGGVMDRPSATFMNLADNLEGYYTKTTDPSVLELITRTFELGLNDCVKAIATLFDDLTDYYTAKEITRYYYTLGILTDVARHIADYRSEKNIMLIADTTELLARVIDGSEMPFIYEKTGTTIDHYMIDEFQDTSSMQWHNFRPLLKESLAYRHSNLIVGDVKQSIYRFRNSDWNLLNEQIRKDFLPEELDGKTLMENWRSCRQIVSFNNTLFTAAPEILQSLYNETLASSSLHEEEKAGFFSRIVSAYGRSYQRVAPPFLEKEGHVRIEFIEPEEERSWKEEALERLPSLLEKLQDKGYVLRDMAILTRTKQEGADVANRLLNYQEEHPDSPYRYDIVSDEALFIGSSTSVRFIISLLHHLRKPQDTTYQQMAYYSYLTLTGEFGRIQAGWSEEIEESITRLMRESLYEMTEGIYRLFADLFPSREQAFLQAFLDLVAEFTQREGSDIGRFLQWWEDSGCRTAIATPEGQDAIRILTIHKAKGLGMKVVIVPFCDWEIDHKPTKPVILWCRPMTKPFDRLQLVPVRYSKNLGNTRFASDYFNEKLYAYIDNLNTLYVAFTRAKEELIVWSPRPPKLTKEGEVEKVDSISKLLWAGLSVPVTETREGEPLAILPDSFDRDSGLFEMGDWWQSDQKTKETGAEEINVERLASVMPGERLQLRLYGKDLFFDDPKRKHGALMHELLSRIHTREDIRTSIESYRQEGVVSPEEAGLLGEQLERLLNITGASDWYDGSMRVLNEVEILFGNGQSRRPDRVMLTKEGEVIVVDYKFGEQTNKRYHTQVRNYMQLIQQMGYSHVKGFLWYVTLSHIEEVIL